MGFRKTLILGTLLLTAFGLSGCVDAPAETLAIPQVGAGGGETHVLSAVQAAPTVQPGENLATVGMRPIAGQAATCGGSRSKSFDLEVIETTVDLGGGTTFAAWTYDGGVPGPTIEVCEGDDVTINVVNKGTTAHGLDTHAFKIDATHYGPTEPGTTLTMQKVVDTPGVYMYHCASGPVTDLHIKSGLHGAMIVYPRDETLRPARELVIVQGAIYGDPDASGLIPGIDPNRTLHNDPTRMIFNGNLAHGPLAVQAGELVRVYFVNVSPGVSAAHVIGTILEQQSVTGVQTWAVPAGSGAIFEFVIPESGLFHFVDHDKLGYLPLGFVLSFQGEEAETERRGRVQSGPSRTNRWRVVCLGSRSVDYGVVSVDVRILAAAGWINPMDRESLQLRGEVLRKDRFLALLHFGDGPPARFQDAFLRVLPPDFPGGLPGLRLHQEVLLLLPHVAVAEPEVGATFPQGFRRSDVQAKLLARLAQRCLFECLVKFEAATRRDPEAFAVRKGILKQQRPAP